MTDITRDSRTVSSRLPPITGVLLAVSLLALPAVSTLVAVTDFALDPVAVIAVQWVVAGVVVGVAVGVEGRSLADLGLRRPAWIDGGYLLGTTVLTLGVFLAAGPVLRTLGLPVESGVGTASMDASLPVALAGAVTIGIVEELLFRGYPIERLLEYTESPVLAGGLPWAVFVAAHAPTWSLGNLVSVSLVAALLTVVYLRRRTLVPVVGTHVLVWVVAVLGQFYG